jgi:hydrogenase maturation protease
MTASRGGALVAGIGNVFLGDDGFGVEVAKRLSMKPLRPGVHVVDVGIRGLDLAYQLLEAPPYDQVILLDALPRGGTPGTLYVLEPAVAEGQDAPALEAHTLDPAQMLAWVRGMGGTLGTIRIVGCEPAQIPADGDIHVGLSAPVSAVVDDAVALVEELLDAHHA